MKETNENQRSHGRTVIRRQMETFKSVDDGD